MFSGKYSNLSHLCTFFSTALTPPGETKIQLPFSRFTGSSDCGINSNHSLTYLPLSGTLTNYLFQINKFKIYFLFFFFPYFFHFFTTV